MKKIDTKLKIWIERSKYAFHLHLKEPTHYDYDDEAWISDTCEVEMVELTPTEKKQLGKHIKVGQVAEFNLGDIWDPVKEEKA